jgi:hypothetical protein
VVFDNVNVAAAAGLGSRSRTRRAPWESADLTLALIGSLPSGAAGAQPHCGRRMRWSQVVVAVTSE